MIDYKRSAELNNMDIDELKAWFIKYPGSGRKIIAICDNPDCCKERELNFQLYRNLCNLCSKRTPEARENSKRAQLKYNNEHPRKR